MTHLDQRILLSRDDGSLGPLLRIAEDRLPAGRSYGGHAHRAVDVVAVVLDGSLRHGRVDGGEDAVVAAGDVAVLHAGAGLDHDETAGENGVRVLQCYLRGADPAATPRHQVRRAAGWVDLDRSDVRLWATRLAPGESGTVPGGLLLLWEPDRVTIEQQDGRRITGPGTALVWQLETSRPAWAQA